MDNEWKEVVEVPYFNGDYWPYAMEKRLEEGRKTKVFATCDKYLSMMQSACS